jgi:transcriptional regulator with XRE-family HTH domain
MQLGRKIRDLRLRRGLTVQKLAEASHLSKGFISQVENDRTSPSLATLRDLAAALQTSVAYLVVEDDPTLHVMRVAERPRVQVGSVSKAEVLSALPKRNLEMLMLELEPEAATGEKRHSHHGEECVLCVEGQVRLLHGEQDVVLSPGDCCHYDGRVPHAIENVGADLARILLAMTPAAFEAPLSERAPRPAATTAPEEAPVIP